MKTIGVLGGLGPQATMDFEARVHRVAQRLIPPSYNRGYPPMVVYYFRHAPGLLTDEDKPVIPHRPDPRLLEAAKWLGGLADFLVITANSAHLFRAEIEQAAGCKVLSMIDTTLDEVRRRKWKRVGVLGLVVDPLARPSGGTLRHAYPGLLVFPQSALDDVDLPFAAGQHPVGLHAALDAGVHGGRHLIEAGVDLVVGAHVAAMKDVGKVGCRPGPIAAAAARATR